MIQMTAGHARTAEAAWVWPRHGRGVVGGSADRLTAVYFLISAYPPIHEQATGVRESPAFGPFRLPRASIHVEGRALKPHSS